MSNVAASIIVADQAKPAEDPVIFGAPPLQRVTVTEGLRIGRRVYRELSHSDRVHLAWSTTATIVGSALAGIFPLLVGWLVSRELGRSKFSTSSIMYTLGVVGGIVVFRQLLEVVRHQLVENVATGLERDVRVKTYQKLLRSDIDLVRQGRVGGIHSRIGRGIEGATKLLKLAANDLIPSMTIAVAAIAAAFYHDAFAALLMVWVIPVGFALVVWQVRNQAGIRVDVRHVKEDIDAQLNELLVALEAVRAVSAQAYLTEAIRTACNRLRQKEFRHHKAMSYFDFLKSLNEGFWLIAVLAFTLIHEGHDARTGAAAVITNLLLYMGVIQPLRDLHRFLDETSESASQAQALFATIDRPEDEAFASSNGKRSIDAPAQGSERVVLGRNIRFTYPGTTQPVLRGIDLDLCAGDRIGFAGPSGCGKSTLLKLLRRLHHGYEGRIELLGRDLRSYTHDELAQRIGYVDQRPTIFHGTVAHNIVMGRPGISRDAIMEAARRAHIHDAIVNMPDGYDTIVSERGSNLSGGQQQRICLARTLVTTPALVLLDEPTSALDPESQRAVQNAIDSLEGLTMIIVAHRLSTLRRTDRILVFEEGRIRESGSFDELSKLGGIFTKMLNLETAAQEVALATGQQA